MRDEQDMNARKCQMESEAEKQSYLRVTELEKQNYLSEAEREKQNYLSDQELEQLILQVEQNELVAAPPDLAQEILCSLDASTYGLEYLPETMPKQVLEQRPETMPKQVLEQRPETMPKQLSEAWQKSIPKQLSEQQTEYMLEKSGNSVIAVREKRPRTRGQRRAEFCRYCLQVTAAAAAAILVVFTLPDFLNTRRVEISTKQEYETAPVYPTKEDVLTEQSILGKVFGGKNIFSKQTNWLFKNETGG